MCHLEEIELRAQLAMDDQQRRKSEKAFLLCLLAGELILSPPLTHCPSLPSLHMKYLQPTTVT